MFLAKDHYDLTYVTAMSNTQNSYRLQTIIVKYC